MNEVHTENRTPVLTPRVNKRLLDIDARIAKSSWKQTKEYMDASLDDGRNVSPDYCNRLLHDASGLKHYFFFDCFAALSISRRFWVGLPCFARASVYDLLLHIGSRIYGHSLSVTVFKLPFGLYLRKGSPNNTEIPYRSSHAPHGRTIKPYSCAISD